MSELLRRRRGDLAALLLLVGITTLLFADVLFGSQRFFIRDLTRYYFPTKRIIREIVLGNEFPYWNPYYSAGQPMAANPEYEIFYPLQYLILLPSYDLGYRLHILVHFYIVAIGLYLLLRSLDLRISSSLFGSVSLGLGGGYMSLGNLLPIFFAAVWIPWILLFARRLFLRPNLRDFGLAGFFLGLQNLVGEPTTMLQTWFLIGSYALYRSWYDAEPWRRVLGRNLLLVVLLIACGMAVGAAQILPALDHVGDSARSRPFTFELVTAWSLPFARPLELIFPNVFGHIYQRGTWFWGGGMYPGMGSPFLFSIYLGLFPALLLVAGIFTRQRGGGLVLLIVLLAVVLALGRHTPLYEWLYKAHIATSIRYPEKFAFMGLFAGAIFAAVLFDRLLSGELRLQNAFLRIALVIFAIALGVAIFSYTDTYGRLFRELWGQQRSPNAAFLTRMSQQDWVVAAFRCGVAVILAWLLRLAGRDGDSWLKSAWSGISIAFLVVDVAPTCRNVLPRVHRQFFTPPTIVRSLDRDQSRYRIFHEVDWYGNTDVAKKFFGTGDAVYWIVRNGLFPMTTAAWGFRTVLERDYDKTQLHPTIDLTEALWKVKGTGRSEWRDIFMAMSNGRYSTQYRDFEREAKRVGGRFKMARPVDMIQGEAHPRYYFAQQIVTIRDQNEFVKKLTGERFHRRAAFVSFPAFPAAQGTIRIAKERANSIALDLNAHGQALVVLSVTPHKYWRASLDGNPVALQRVNLGYQGVIVPAGPHRLELRYRNTLVLAGGAVTLVSVLILVTMIAVPRRAARNENSAS